MNGSSSHNPGETPERWLIVGGGSFGTAFARIMGFTSAHVTLAARDAEHVAAMQKTRTNPRYFPDFTFPENTTITTIDEALQHEWDGIVLAVPTSAFHKTLARCAGRAPLYLSLAKGLDPEGRRLSEGVQEIIPVEQFVVLSGPNIALEIMRDQPTAAVVAGIDQDAVVRVQRAINGITFRVYASEDLVGVELAGASKNVVAIAAGVVEAAGFGDNGLAAMMTRGLGEMARLGLAYGAELQTYLGLAGVGDLITTCASPHSRNKRAGKLLAEGKTAAEAQAEIGQVVEGLRSAPVVLKMAQDRGVKMNLCETVVDVALHGMPLEEVAMRAMSRPPTYEFESHHVFDPPSAVK